MFLRRKRHQENVEHKEVLIKRTQRKLDQTMDQDLEKLNRLTEILGNGISLKIFVATRRNHAR